MTDVKNKEYIGQADACSTIYSLEREVVARQKQLEILGKVLNFIKDINFQMRNVKELCYKIENEQNSIKERLLLVTVLNLLVAALHWFI